MNRILILLFSCFFLSQLSAEEKEEKIEKLDVLVFSKTEGYRHQSISNGIKMMSELAQEYHWEVTSTENSDFFSNDFLKRFDVVVFLNPTLDVLSEKQQRAFQNFMESGKGFIGIHASADCEYEWEWFGKLNGAYFSAHPPAQVGTVIFEDYNHPAMEAFKEMETYTTFDEWYTFKANPREEVNVLARLDESSIKEAKNDDWKMGDHPLIWWQEFDDIRSFYTVFGHTDEAFDDPNIRKHIAGAIEWAGKRID
jgi:type 1 glutamine amidotransferase